MSNRTESTNQSIISFFFDGEEFIIDVSLVGVRQHTPLFNALTAHQFIVLPMYDSIDPIARCAELIPVEQLDTDLTHYLQHQSI